MNVCKPDASKASTSSASGIRNGVQGLTDPNPIPHKIRRCRRCGHEGYDVTPGIYKTRDGRYVKVDRCQDHLACDSRKAAL